MAGVVIIDDSDPMVSYNPSWTQEADPDALSGGIHYSTQIGDLATVTFTGTAISVFGVVIGSRSQSSSSYTIDGSVAGQYNRYPGRIGYGTIVHNVLFFQSGTLSPGSHTLVVNRTGTGYNYGAPAGPARLSLDYFEYTPISSSNTSTTNSPTNSVSGSFATTPTEDSATTPSVSQGGNTPSSSSQIPTSTLIGVVIGAVVALLVIWFFSWRFRRKLKPPVLNSQGQLTPFTGAGTLTHASAASPESSYENEGAHDPFDNGKGYTVRGGISHKEVNSLPPGQSSEDPRPGVQTDDLPPSYSDGGDHNLPAQAQTSNQTPRGNEENAM